MARFMVSMPDEMLKKLDRLAKREHRSRSELLREAARRYLNQPEEVIPEKSKAVPLASTRRPPKWTRKKLEQYLLDKGVITRRYSGLERLLGPVTGPVDMEQVLEIGKKLTGISQQIIEDREDRV